jgi:hypothetical protein
MALVAMATCVPAGIVTPLENVNGRNTRRVAPTGKKSGAHQLFIIRTLGKESNERAGDTSIRIVSRTKLSILCILSIAALVHPSSATTASTSSRSGSIYSGWERRLYNTCVKVCGQEVIGAAS